MIQLLDSIVSVWMENERGLGGGRDEVPHMFCLINYFVFEFIFFHVKYNMDRIFYWSYYTILFFDELFFFTKQYRHIAVFLFRQKIILFFYVDYESIYFLSSFKIQGKILWLLHLLYNTLAVLYDGTCHATKYERML